MRPEIDYVRAAAAALALGAALAGCGGPGGEPTEAERFGYKGEDLVDQTNLTFLVTAPTTTNWIPERVVSVFEKYEFSEDELSVVEALGVLMPGESYPKLPEGYAKETDGPWFTYWTKSAESLGLKGVVGVLTHFDEDKAVFETGESYFSSYWDSREDALAALAKVKAALANGFHVKKFHEISDGWVAEYVRLGVMGVVGQKADGTWSCMLDIQDKNRPGCGQWEAPDAQAERLAEYNYRKAVAAWKAEKDKIVAGNHEKIEAMRKERDLAPFGGDVRAFDAEDGRKVYVRGGYFDMSNVVEEVVWNEKREGLEKATGTKFEGEIVKRDFEDKYSVWGAGWTNDIYEVRLDMAFPAKGEKGEWRELCFEVVQEGFAIPPRPRLDR